MNKAYKYSDISLIPNYSECLTRSNCDTSVEFFGKRYKLPIIPANMKSVIDSNLSRWMSENDYFYIMHRFNEDIYSEIETANRESWKTISFSIGVQDKDKTIIHKLRTNKLRVDYLTIDIAHGHSIKMKRMIKFIKENLTDTKIIAGNVATPEAVKDLERWGADIIKVGVGQGSPCTTKDKTGFTVPMFSCVQSCSDIYSGQFIQEIFKKIPIIADGGVSCNGDIAKALVAGADMVMAGGLFAACTDSPARLIKYNGDYLKGYFGSASYENKKCHNHIEGKLTVIQDNKMTYEKKLLEIEEDLQSAISYAGGNDLDIFSDVCYHAV
jgi:GMP reductase